MILFLTGSPTRFGEDHFTSDNAFLDEVRLSLAAVCPGGRPRVLLVSAAPDDRAFTESVLKGMSDCIHRSGIETEEIIMLDRRNASEAAGRIHPGYDELRPLHRRVPDLGGYGSFR